MNKILFKEAQPLGNDTILVPFICSDINGMRLDEPAINRTDNENVMAVVILKRIRAVLNTAGFELVDFSFRSMTLSIKPLCFPTK